MILVDQRIGQLTDMLLGYPSKRADSLFGNRVPCEQRNHVGNERRGECYVVPQDRRHAFAIARTERENLLDLRICALQGIRSQGSGNGGRGRVVPFDSHGRLERPEHDRPRGYVLHVGEVELESTIEQVPFQRFDVAAIEPPRNDQRRSRRCDGANQNRRVLARGGKQQEQSYEASADGITQAIEPDVDDRFRRTLFTGGDGGVEEFVAGAEQRAAENRFGGADNHHPLETGRDQAADAADDQRDGRRARRGCQPEPLGCESTGGGLEDESDEAGCRVKDREEAQQAVAASKRRHRFGLEQVIEQGGARRSQQDDGSEPPEVGRAAENAQARVRRLRRRFDSAC